MSDLTVFRDHARKMAASKPTDRVNAARRGHVPYTVPIGPLTDAERALWTRLADEVDAYLAADPEDDVLPVIDDDQLNLLEAP